MVSFYGYTEETFPFFLKKNDSIKSDIENQYLIMSISEYKKSLYCKLIEACNDFELIGKNMLYASSNSCMFLQPNKEGEIGVRLPIELEEEFKGKYNAAIFTSYRANR